MQLTGLWYSTETTSTGFLSIYMKIVLLDHEIISIFPEIPLNITLLNIAQDVALPLCPKLLALGEHQ